MKIDLERYLIQRYPMRLIDSVIEVTDHLVKCKAVVKEENVFYDPAICGIRSWVGLEFMAQTAAVFASFKNSQQSLPQIGFLISIRKFLCAELYFKLNDILIITAENLYMEDGVGFRSHLQDSVRFKQ